MSGAKHTPGPWRLNDPIHAELVDHYAGYFCIDAGKGFSGAGFGLSGFMSIHDARLIAAAPDMRAALLVARDHLSPRRDDPMALAALEVVESAISLAERGA